MRGMTCQAHEEGAQAKRGEQAGVSRTVGAKASTSGRSACGMGRRSAGLKRCALRPPLAPRPLRARALRARQPFHLQQGVLRVTRSPRGAGSLPLAVPPVRGAQPWENPLIKSAVAVLLLAQYPWYTCTLCFPRRSRHGMTAVPGVPKVPTVALLPSGDGAGVDGCVGGGESADTDGGKEVKEKAREEGAVWLWDAANALVSDGFLPL
ncbi:hypothetical protein FGB62_318g00 [Gracilaria domingensis]|nr:hypothetical protein FGB62_318g00 [Gracilaria domingensis]